MADVPVPHPAPLAAHYARFRVSERLLLTGHSHQAWPDVAERGMLQAFADAAELVDEKWSRAFGKADAVRAGFRRLLGGCDGEIALASNTHELLVRWLSALDLRQRSRLITTDSEFHTVRRQFNRLQEEGIEIVRVPATPTASVADRLRAELDGRTAGIVCSSVFFTSAQIAGGDFAALAAACATHGAELLLDAYHLLNVVPFTLPAGNVWVTGGGYKYTQLGEGNCFLRIPPHCSLRPVYTGWYAEFDELEAPKRPGEVPYGMSAQRFAGSTYDPVSHYRAAEVFAFFERENLDVGRLRRISQHQVAMLQHEFDALDLSPDLVTRDRDVPLNRLGGFLALQSPHAGPLHDLLRAAGVLTDYRGTILRFGPAPYLSDRQLADSMAALGVAARLLPRN